MTKEELIKMLQSCDDRETIIRDKFCVRFDIESSELYKLVGGMRNLRKMSGIKFHWQEKNVDSVILMNELKRIFKETKIPVTQRMFDEMTNYSSSDVANKFGSWKIACEKAEVPYAGKTCKTQLFNTNCLKNVLNAKGITKVETEKTFEGLINPETGKKLRFDYYVEELSLLIEVDGFTHFDKERSERAFGKNSFEKSQKLDAIKNDFAKKNNIRLIRIKQQNWNLKSLSKMFDLDSNISFEFDVDTKQEKIANIISKEKMIELYVNQKLSDKKISEMYKVDYNLIYNLRMKYGIKSRSCKEQKRKMDVVKLIECYLNDVPYRFMPEICGAKNCYRTLQRILKENPSIADVKSLKKSGKSRSGQSDLKVEIFDRPPYISFADGNI